MARRERTDPGAEQASQWPPILIWPLKINRTPQTPGNVFNHVADEIIGGFNPLGLDISEGKYHSIHGVWIKTVGYWNICGNSQHINLQCEGVLEYWSTGVLGLNAEKYLIFYSLTLVFPSSNHGSYLSIIPTIQHSITPSLQYSSNSDAINCLL